MVGCSIRNCKSRSVKGGSIMFFSFPQKESVANEWLRYCGSKTTKKNGRVCSNHFLPSDYYKPLTLILLNKYGRNARQLRPDAIPTLQIDSIDKQNTPNMSVEEKCEISHAPDNINCLSRYNTVPDNEVAGSSKVVEKSDKSISVSVAECVSLKRTANEFHAIKNGSSENRNCLSQCNIVPAIEVAGSSKVDEKSDKSISVSVAQYVTLKRTANEFHAIKNGSSENRNCLSQYYTIVPANQVAESSKVVKKSDKTISVSVSEHESLKRTANEFHTLKNNLEKIFTPGQIRCLMAPEKHRIVWSAEDIAAAILLKNISQKAYRHLRLIVGIPLPALSTLRYWASKFGIKEELLENSAI